MQAYLLSGDTATVWCFRGLHHLFGPGIDDSVDLSRYSPELDSHGQYSLPASGKYELRVLQTRNDARKNKTKKYNVDIQIK
ncbi:hypothetical protein CES94_11080 [Escherichia coli]|nr:hypothetical protein CES94_11080 [Escherichia coli]